MAKIKLNELLDKEISTIETFKINKHVVEVKTAITTDEFVAFVELATSLSYDKNDEYNAAFERIALRYAVVKYLTNIDIEDMTVNDVFDATLQMWYDGVMRIVEGTSYWYELLSATKENIMHKNTIRTTAFDNLCGTLADAIERFAEDNTNAETIEKLSAIANKLNKVDSGEVARAIIADANEKNKIEPLLDENGEPVVK